MYDGKGGDLKPLLYVAIAGAVIITLIIVFIVLAMWTALFSVIGFLIVVSLFSYFTSLMERKKIERQFKQKKQ